MVGSRPARSLLVRLFVLVCVCVGAGPSACAHSPTPGEEGSAGSVEQTPLLMGADLHLHFTMDRSARPLFQGHSGGNGPASARANNPSDFLENQLDVDEMRRAGVRVVLASVWPSYDFSPNTRALDQALRGLNDLRHWADHQHGVVVAYTPEQALKAVKHDHIALIPTLEGAEGIERIEDVDTLYAAGLRVVQLAHITDNGLCGAATGQLSKSWFGHTDAEPNPKGLTPLGTEVVKRLVKRGMVIDLAHASDRTAADVMALTEAQKVPLLYTHGGARAFSSGERNLPDELAKQVAARGGLVGVSFFRNAVTDVPENERWPGFVLESCDATVAHWRHLAQVVGAESVTLGSDFNGFILRPKPGGDCPQGIRGTQDLPTFFSALEKHGVPRSSLDRSGARLLEIWAKVIEIGETSRL